MAGIYRVRIINPDQSISVLDKTFSQTVEMTLDLDKEKRDAFWDHKETKLESGHSVVFVKQVG